MTGEDGLDYLWQDGTYLTEEKRWIGVCNHTPRRVHDQHLELFLGPVFPGDGSQGVRQALQADICSYDAKEISRCTVDSHSCGRDRLSRRGGDETLRDYWVIGAESVLKIIAEGRGEAQH